MDCMCTKEHELKTIQNELIELKKANQLQDDKIEAIRLADVQKESDIRYIKETLDKLNKTINNLTLSIEKLNSKPLQRYEKGMWIALSVAITYLVTKIIGG